MLLAKGADVEIKDDQGKTPYYWAKEYKHDEILPFLEVFAFQSMKDLPPLPPDPVSETKTTKKLSLYDYTKHHDATKITIHIIKKQEVVKKKKTTKKKKSAK